MAFFAFEIPAFIISLYEYSELIGNLIRVEENYIVLEMENNQKIELEFSQISSAHTVYDFETTLKEKNPVNLNKLNKFNKK